MGGCNWIHSPLRMLHIVAAKEKEEMVAVQGGAKRDRD